MSAWSDIKPHVVRVSGLLPENDLFQDLILVEKYGYFSKKRYGVSGYYKEKFLLIVLDLLKPKAHSNKKIYNAVIFHREDPDFKVSRVIFKRDHRYSDRDFGKVTRSFAIHASLQKGFPDAVAKAPALLGVIRKGRKGEEYLRFDTYEEPYPTTLSRNHVIKEKLSLQDAIDGLYRVAVALQSLHGSKFIHGDIKNWNVFVADKKLLIFDFELAEQVPIYTFQKNDYEFWDGLSNMGVRHPFCDVFGWTLILGEVLWGHSFHSIWYAYRKETNLMKEIVELYKDNKESATIPDFHKAAYVFLCRILNKNRDAYSLASAAAETPQFVAVMKEQVQRLPTMNDCIQFIRPWVSRPILAK